LDPTRAALRDEVAKQIEGSELAPYKDTLLALLRPVVHLQRIEVGPKLGGSKFGGVPDLPPDAVWPEHAGGPYEFVAQLNLEDCPNAGLLPTRGLLSVFAATEPSEEVFWGEPNYVRVLYTDASATLSPREAPPRSAAQLAEDEEVAAICAKLGKGYEPTAKARPEGVAVRMVPSLDFPRGTDQRKDWSDLGVERGPALWDLMARLDELLRPLLDKPDGQQIYDHLLGYPGQSSLGYDPTPGPEWVYLLCLSSHDDLGWCWHDGDYLHVSIERSRLEARDFSKLGCDAG
jgi:hypothetical protein